MASFVKLSPENLTVLRQVDERLVSYNVEMTEVTGGTFWKAYTQAQVEGREEFPVITDWANMANMLEWFDPIDTTNPRLAKLAKEIGPVWIRVSGGWANKTYYDFDGHTNGQVPEGYQSILTKDQWINLLRFVKAVGGKLLVSFANCPGNHKAGEPWNPDQAKLLMDTSREYGVPVSAAEFTNEPNMIPALGFGPEYTVEDFAREHDAFGAWLRENYPDCLFIGPCSVGDSNAVGYHNDNAGGGLAIGFDTITADALLGEYKTKMDAFSYHYYNGVSERGAAMGGHWPYETILSDAYLAVAGHCARYYGKLRDIYVPGGQLWVTESGDAGCGGNTWASTYADVPRTLNELGDFASISDGVIFHNTLASSDYGFLDHKTFLPRPNYFAVVLWNRIMGTTVYECGETSEGMHVFCHSRRDGKPGYAYLLINGSWTDTATVELPVEADVYALTGKDGMRSLTMCLNGRELALGENDELPPLIGKKVSGKVEVAPGSCTFIVL